MAIRPKGSGWQVDVTWKGQRAPRVSCATMGEAKRVEAQYLAGLIAGKAPQPASGPARVAGYKSDVGTGRLMDYTVRSRWKGTKARFSSERNARRCCEHLGYDFPVASITAEVISNMADEWATQGNAGATIKRGHPLPLD